MRVGDLEVLARGFSCLSVAIAPELAWLGDQPSIAVGVARGIKELTPKVKDYLLKSVRLIDYCDTRSKLELQNA